MNLHGYDPARITLLSARTREALAALGALHASDPEAADAMRAVRLAKLNLAETWIPALDAILSSTAMVTWRAEQSLLAGGLEEFTADLVARWGQQPADPHRHRDAWVIAGLRRALDRLTATLDGRAGSPDLDTAIRVVHQFLTIAARRATQDRRLARRWWHAEGPEGLNALIDNYERLRLVIDRGLTGTTRDEVHHDSRLTDIDRGFVEFLGAVWAEHPDALEVSASRAVRSPAMARAVLTHRDVVDLTALSAFGRALAHHSTRIDHRSLVNHVHDHRDLTADYLRAIAATPGEALSLLADPALTRALATTRQLRADVIERFFASALGAPDLHGEYLATQIEVFAELARTTQNHDLGPGAARGIALGTATLFPQIAAHLDRRLPVIALIEDAGAVEATMIGTYEDIARLIGALMVDNRAQLTLGVTVGAYRSDQLRAATAAIRPRPSIGNPTDTTDADRQVAESRAIIGGHLADATRVIELVLAGRQDRDDILAFRHGIAQARSQELVNLLGNAAATALPISRQVTTLTTRAISTAIGNQPAPRTTETGIESELAVQFTELVLDIPVRDPGARRALGLLSVPMDTWTQLDILLVELGTSDDPQRRAQLHGRLLGLVTAHPDLDAYLETARALSGEDRLG